MSPQATHPGDVTGYRNDDDGSHPPLDYPGYRSTALRAPRRPLIWLPPTLSEVTGPAFGHARIEDTDSDLTRQHEGEPIGDRIIVAGRVLDGDGHPVRNTLVEVWQANAAGRYRHPVDRHPAPLDPNFTGAGRCLTDEEGRYRFLTIKPGAYPWGNHHNAWRAAHIHFSLFGPAFSTRLITQMYFPGDPLLTEQDPVWWAVPDPRARRRLVSTFDLDHAEPNWALAYRFDIVLKGRDETPMEG